MQGDRFCSADGGMQWRGGGEHNTQGCLQHPSCFIPKMQSGCTVMAWIAAAFWGPFSPLWLSTEMETHPPSHAGKSPPPLYTPPSFNQGSNEEHRKGLMPVHAWSLPGPGDKWPRDSNGQIRICIAVPSARSPRRAALLPNTRCKERSAGALHVNAWRWGGGSGGGGGYREGMGGGWGCGKKK